MHTVICKEFLGLRNTHRLHQRLVMSRSQSVGITSSFILRIFQIQLVTCSFVTAHILHKAKYIYIYIYIYIYTNHDNISKHLNILEMRLPHSKGK